MNCSLSTVEPLKNLFGFHTVCRCAQPPRSNVLPKYASARRFFARLASEIFLSGRRDCYQDLNILDWARER